MKIKYNEITLSKVLPLIDNFLPIKIIFNDIILYNDMDGEGEFEPPLVVIPKRIEKIKNSLVNSINIEIVQFHHSIITMRGSVQSSRAE